MQKKGKKLSVKKAAAQNSEINVTPLVDVVLVLLIIFMVVTPLLEKDLDVRLPDTEKVETTNDLPPDQLIVRINAEGELKINSEKITPEEYIDKLRAKLEKKKANDKVVFFIADDKANYAKLVTALDGAKQAGAEALGMATEETEEKPDSPAPAP